MKLRLWWAYLLLVVAGISLPSAARVAAGNETLIRFAYLAPAGSSWDRVFKAWGKSLSDKTGGQVKFQFFAGGVAGDERDVIRKMKLGQLDASSFTTIGLAQIARPLTLLMMPGIINGPAQLNTVRTTLASEFDEMFAKEGYKLLGWGDAGFGRIFSKKPILTPADYKSVRPWTPRDDNAFAEFMKIIGANGVPLGIPEVFPALQTGMVDTVISSAIAAVALQWFRNLPYVSKEATVPIVGATLLRQEALASLSPENARILLETGKAAQDLLIHQVQGEDTKAYATLTSKMGLKEFSTMSSPEQKKAWDSVNEQLHKNLTGKIWSPELYKKVTAAASWANN